MTLPQLIKKYKNGDRLTMITAYDATFAKIAHDAGIDMILVGDSLGMVVQGRNDTISVTLDDIIYHTRCVSRGASNAFIIADLPFMSYQTSQTRAMLAAGKAMKEGRANAVKIEGGLEMADTVNLMSASGIPVIAHIGLRPQTVNTTGGYKIQGKTKDEAKLLMNEAIEFERAGASIILIEGVAMETTRDITNALSIPTIGIASGAHCSGQVLVIYDLLGFNPSFKPKFLKTYTNGYEMATNAIKKYIEEVSSGNFPDDLQSFHCNNTQN